MQPTMVPRDSLSSKAELTNSEHVQHVADLYTHVHSRRQRSISLASITPAVGREFWRRVSLDESGCWVWVGALHGEGYGLFNVEPRRQVRAHRVAWVMAFGEIHEGLIVCHRCDRPPCVNPGHLFLGEPKDNSLDMVLKGRASRGRAKLTDVQVAEIRFLAGRGLSITEIALAYRVCEHTVRSILAWRTWRRAA